MMLRPCSALLLFIALSAPVSYGGESQVNGHVRGQVLIDGFSDDDYIADAESENYFFGGSADFRFNSTLFIYDNISLEAAYEAAITGGQRRKAVFENLSDPAGSFFLGQGAPSDEQQLFSMTKVVSDKDDYLVYHRIDRLAVTIDSDFGTVKAGRQALTWGNGMIFNPADVINPFAPADVIRDYKTGSDMLLYHHGAEIISDVQLVYVPRRNSDSGDVSWSESTLGSKLRMSFNETDGDLYAIKNYQDYILGAGITGYLYDAAYRIDITETFLEDEYDKDSYFSAVANLDYSWVVSDRNWYGMIELYYNGIGNKNVTLALENVPLLKRMQRGELFVAGRWYLDGMLQYEAHPLVNIFFSLICNIDDLSLLLQPRVTWDVTQSSQVLVGLNVPVGNRGDEFRSLVDDDTGITLERGFQFYAVATWYF